MILITQVCDGASLKALFSFFLRILSSPLMSIKNKAKNQRAKTEE